ncbi:hypothetical protein LRS74_28005 [Streptomyces sp. LX-29]|uniref:hypothetical protein n=1 Tax=Streptomyces sp. LX-29 TaxID=2900152 RepID=UPI00240E721D|nr:hypothetical protein [Streptomyces sp. LX-29]WFB10453.1 hypothetical protein LRS74_28005 [Streptomyces sp. LX-29]
MAKTKKASSAVTTQQILDALKGLTDTVSNQAVIDERKPSAEQARVILDYGVLTGLLELEGKRVALVAMKRTHDNAIEFPEGVPAGAVKVAATSEGGKSETVRIKENRAQLTKVSKKKSLIRVELQRRDGVPVGLGRRLSPAPPPPPGIPRKP